MPKKSEKKQEETKKLTLEEYEKKISKILKDKYVNPDLKNVEKKLEKIEEHLKKNHQDKKAKRERSRVFSQVRKIKKYLKKL
jgi:ribosomal protein S15P/S13E